MANKAAQANVYPSALFQGKRLLIGSVRCKKVKGFNDVGTTTKL